MKQTSELNFAIYVDADACPVKAETINIGIRYIKKIYLVSNGGIRPYPNPLVKTVVVSSGPNEADNWIVDNIKKNDIVITSDIPLSDRSIKKGAYVISHNGETINRSNIGLKVASRNLMSGIRSANPFYPGSGKSFGKMDRIKYMNTLEKIIQTIKKSL